MMGRFRFSDNRGFTLIELMIVVVIIGILAAIAIPKFGSVTQKAKETEAKTLLKQLYTLERAYYDENGSYNATASTIGFTTTAAEIKYWTITIPTATATTFTVVATEKADTNGDGDTADTWTVTQVGPTAVFADGT